MGQSITKRRPSGRSAAAEPALSGPGHLRESGAALPEGCDLGRPSKIAELAPFIVSLGAGLVTRRRGSASAPLLSSLGSPGMPLVGHTRHRPDLGSRISGSEAKSVHSTRGWAEFGGARPRPVQPAPAVLAAASMR